MRFKAGFVLTTLALASSLPVGARSQETATGRIPTVSRLVQLFSRLEVEWMEAASRGDAKVLAGLVADDFEARSAKAPGVPTPRAEWLAAARGVAAPEPSDIAVRALGDVAIVSCRMTRDGHHTFVVDVWLESQKSWKVVARYATGSE
jgi:Domain of unknown function (DUF4440)